MKRVLGAALCSAALLAGLAPATAAAAPDETLPALTRPVNDFAHVIDPANAAALDRLSRALQAASGDVVVVATVQNIQPYGDIREYANKLFENHGRGIGDKGKDNGLLIVVAVNERRASIEVGYTLEQWITDGFSGETIRDVMIPEFRNGNYGAGLRAGAERIVGRIAEGRGVTLEAVPRSAPQSGDTPLPLGVVIAVFIAILVLSRLGGGPGAGVRRWGRGGWSGWSSGVGPFGGGWTGGGFGGGGGGFGGGFGGFGGGRSGGGGAGGSW